MERKRGIQAILFASFLVVAVLVTAASADTIVAPLSTISLGEMMTDGTANTAQAMGAGSVTAPAGWNTFTVSCTNSNDVDNDGQGAVYELKVWDAAGHMYTDSWETDRAGTHTLSVHFNSQGEGDAQYELYCQTNTWLDVIEDQDTYTGDLDFF